MLLGAERLPAASLASSTALNVPGRRRRARILARNRLSFAPAAAELAEFVPPTGSDSCLCA